MKFLHNGVCLFNVNYILLVKNNRTTRQFYSFFHFAVMTSRVEMYNIAGWYYKRTDGIWYMENIMVWEYIVHFLILHFYNALQNY